MIYKRLSIYIDSCNILRFFSQLSISSGLIVLYITCFCSVHSQNVLNVESSRLEISISLLYILFFNSCIQDRLSRLF